MVSHEITLDLKEGLQAKPASEIIQYLKDFTGNITMKYAGQTANCKSIINLLALEAGPYPTVEISIDGEEEEEELEDFIEFLKDLGEKIGE